MVSETAFWTTMLAEQDREQAESEGMHIAPLLGDNEALEPE
jgi:hypothetical protein